MLYRVTIGKLWDTQVIGSVQLRRYEKNASGGSQVVVHLARQRGFKWHKNIQIVRRKLILRFIRTASRPCTFGEETNTFVMSIMSSSRTYDHAWEYNLWLWTWLNLITKIFSVRMYFAFNGKVSGVAIDTTETRKAEVRYFQCKSGIDYAIRTLETSVRTNTATV
jgi:hypothetical protein